MLIQSSRIRGDKYEMYRERVSCKQTEISRSKTQRSTLGHIFAKRTTEGYTSLYEYKWKQALAEKYNI